MAGCPLISRLSDFDPVVIQCGGEDAAFHVVLTVISPMTMLHVQQLLVYGNYVPNSVTPTDVILRSVARIQDKERIPTYSLNMVFIPVYEGGRWWCVIFSFNRAEIVVVDAALSTHASEVHHLSLGKIRAMDLVLQRADPTWQAGLMRGWTVPLMK
ncbi:COMPASS component SWD1, partial [Bienertia sinuspersici]